MSQIHGMYTIPFLAGCVFVAKIKPKIPTETQVLLTSASLRASFGSF
jgi:hypothetical protein